MYNRSNRRALLINYALLLSGESLPGNLKGLSPSFNLISINNFIEVIMIDVTIFNQKHFLWMIDAPCYWKSDFVIHIAWKVVRELKIEPPIHARNCL